MKKLLFNSILFAKATMSLYAVENTSMNFNEMSYKYTAEPGLGVSPMPLADLTFSNLMHIRISNRMDVLSYSSFRVNNPFLRNFNFIKSRENYTLTQKFGPGLSLKGKRSIHTFSLMAGIRYETFKESLENPNFEKVEVAINSLAPDAGIMYSLILGKSRYFVSSRVYLPLTPYPFRTFDFTGIDGNLTNVSFEIGLGIRIK